MKLRVVPKEGGLYPFDEQSQRYLSRLKANDYCEVDVTKKRNPKFHRKYFAMLRLVASQIEEHLDTEDIHDYIKDRLGMYDVVSIGAMVKKKYRSVSFVKMDEIEFQDHYDRSLDVVCDLLGLEHDELIAELESEYF